MLILAALAALLGFAAPRVLAVNPPLTLHATSFRIYTVQSDELALPAYSTTIMITESFERYVYEFNFQSGQYAYGQYGSLVDATYQTRMLFSKIPSVYGSENADGIDADFYLVPHDNLDACVEDPQGGCDNEAGTLFIQSPSTFASSFVTTDTDYCTASVFVTASLTPPSGVFYIMMVVHSVDANRYVPAAMSLDIVFSTEQSTLEATEPTDVATLRDFAVDTEQIGTYTYVFTYPYLSPVSHLMLPFDSETSGMPIDYNDAMIFYFEAGGDTLGYNVGSFTPTTALHVRIEFSKNNSAGGLYGASLYAVQTVRMSIPRTDQTEHLCIYPLNSPSCHCTTVGTVRDVPGSPASKTIIEGYFNCPLGSLVQPLKKMVYVTALSAFTTMQLDGELVITAGTPATIEATATTLSLITTTPTTTATSTPTTTPTSTPTTTPTSTPTSTPTTTPTSTPTTTPTTTATSIPTSTPTSTPTAVATPTETPDPLSSTPPADAAIIEPTALSGASERTGLVVGVAVAASVVAVGVAALIVYNFRARPYMLLRA